MASYDGATAATSFGDVEAEWKLLDEGAALVDAAWKRYFVATGDERGDFLHGQTSASVEELSPGRGAAALVLTAQGKPLGLLAIYQADDRTWIASTALQSAATRTALSRFLVADDCDFEEDLGARCLVVAGPRAKDVLLAAGAAAAAAMDPWSLAECRLGGQAAMLFSRGDLRVPSFDVLACDAGGVASDADAIAAALRDTGAGDCGTGALEILRVESGTARYGVDVDETRLAVEARLEWAIHFAKGCYVGQEVVERAVSRGRINHELCLLAVPEGFTPGAAVDGGGEGDVATSVVRSPRLGPIALAYLPRASTTPGSRVTFAGMEAVVLDWPRPRTLEGRRA